MDLEKNGQLCGSWRSSRRSPWVRSWIPSPLFLYQQILGFFTINTCSERHFVTESVSFEEFDGMTEGLLGPLDTQGQTDIFLDQATSTSSSTTFLSAPVEQKFGKNLKKEFGAAVTSNSESQIRKNHFSQTLSSGERSQTSSSGERSQTSSSGKRACQTLSHFRSEFAADAASGPCPCYISQSDPSRLREFLLEENISDSAQFKNVNSDFGIVSVSASQLRLCEK
jgi:hypothetical protein